MSRNQAIAPRELKEGDVIQRVNPSLEFVNVTVDKVEKIRRDGHTAYQVYFKEMAALPEHQRANPENRHLRPGIYQPRATLTLIVEDPA